MKSGMLTFFSMVVAPAIAFSAVNPVITLSGGVAGTNVYSSSTIGFSPFQNTYVGKNHHDNTTDIGLFIGGETQFQQYWAWQLGASYFVNHAFIATGNVYQFSDPAFNNLTYQYKINSQRVTLDTKLSRVLRQIWHPYVSAGIGAAFNNAHSYIEYPVTSADVPMTQPFSGHTTTSLTYSAGLGVDMNIAPCWRLGGGYRFVGLGNARLGMSPLQTNRTTIGRKHMVANELLLQMTYAG